MKTATQPATGREPYQRPQNSSPKALLDKLQVMLSALPDDQWLDEPDDVLKLRSLIEVREYLGSMAQMKIEDRELVITPILGSYSYPSIWWIDVNGSPPKGSVFYDATHTCPVVAFYYSPDSAKKIKKEAALKSLHAFIEHWTSERRTPFVIKPDGTVEEVVK